MKRGYENSYNILPMDAFARLYSFLNLCTRSSLSSANKTLYQRCSDEAKSLRLFSPVNMDAPLEVLSNLLKRYRNIRHLEFELSSAENYLNRLMSYLKVTPLSRVCSLIVHEILPRRLPHTQQSQPHIEKRNYKFLKAVIHPKLEHLTITKASGYSFLQGERITPLLNNILALKSFEFMGELGAYSFAKHTQLTTLKFYQLEVYNDTIESLKLCTNLTSLSIGYFFTTPNLYPILSQQKWPLKHLEISTVEHIHDLATLIQNFPNLEHFSVTSCFNPSLEDIKAFNCPNLRTLKLRASFLKDSDVFHLKGLSNLEAFVLKSCYVLTGDGVVFLSKNCPNLHTLHLGCIKSLHRTAIEAIVENCPAITHLELSKVNLVKYDDLQYLIQNLENLRQIKLSNIGDLSNDQITTLKSHY